MIRISVLLRRQSRRLRLRFRFAADQGMYSIACDAEACHHYGIVYGQFEALYARWDCYVEGFFYGLATPYVPRYFLRREARRCRSARKRAV